MYVTVIIIASNFPAGALFVKSAAVVVAVKTIRDAGGTSDAEVLHEVEIMKRLRHPNIVSIIGMGP